MTCHELQPIEKPQKGEGGSDEPYPSAGREGLWGEPTFLSPAPAPVLGAAFLGPPTPLPRGPPPAPFEKKIHSKSLEPEGGILSPSGRRAFNGSLLFVSPQAPVPSPAPTPFSRRRVQGPFKATAPSSGQTTGGDDHGR